MTREHNSAQKLLCFFPLSYVRSSEVISGWNFAFFLRILKFDAGQTITDGHFSVHSVVTVYRNYSLRHVHDVAVQYMFM